MRRGVAMPCARHSLLQQRIVGARNRYEYLFFEVKRATNLSTPQNVEVVSAEGMSTRMTRITKRLVDQPLGAQMFRTIFLSWFDGKRPSMAQRKTIASWMMHNVKTQLGTYTKAKRPLKSLTGSGKRRKVTVEDLQI